jgi:hypothetical protein
VCWVFLSSILNSLTLTGPGWSMALLVTRVDLQYHPYKSPPISEIAIFFCAYLHRTFIISNNHVVMSYDDTGELHRLEQECEVGNDVIMTTMVLHQCRFV